jgi:uncharacterized protein
MPIHALLIQPASDRRTEVPPFRRASEVGGAHRASPSPADIGSPFAGGPPSMMPVVHFEIHAADPDAAAKFYADVFGWQVKKWEGPFDYWLVSTQTNGMGIDGAFVRRRGEAPRDGAGMNAYVCTIAVDALDDAIAKVRRHGGELAVDKVEIPGIGWLAYAKDTAGNTFGMLQPNR